MDHRPGVRRPSWLAVGTGMQPTPKALRRPRGQAGIASTFWSPSPSTGFSTPAEGEHTQLAQNAEMRMETATEAGSGVTSCQGLGRDPSGLARTPTWDYRKATCPSKYSILALLS